METKPRFRSGTTYVGTLPPGEWVSRVVGDTIYYLCPDHKPRRVKDGKMEIVEIYPTIG